MKEHLDIILISFVVVILILVWLTNLPSKTVKLGNSIFICDIRKLPDGFYTQVVKEISMRFALYSLSKKIGKYDECYLIHHYQLPKNGDGRFQEDFLIEKGKVIS